MAVARRHGRRTRVWSEPTQDDAAARDAAETVDEAVDATVEAVDEALDGQTREAIEGIVGEAVRLLETGDVSPAEMLDAALTRIAQVEPAVNATVTVCPTAATAARTRRAAPPSTSTAARWIRTVTAC